MATVVADKDLRLRESDVGKGELRLFTFAVDAQSRVNVLVRRKENGTLEVAFASCRRCFQAGSYQQGKDVICGHCREPMEVVKASVKASAPVSPEKDCALLPLPYERRDGELIVRRDEIRQGVERWFRSVPEQR